MLNKLLKFFFIAFVRSGWKWAYETRICFLSNKYKYYIWYDEVNRAIFMRVFEGENSSHIPDDEIILLDIDAVLNDL